MLSDRRQIVLRALIEEYIARALPVGSRTLVERYNLGISSATVRNELSLLEEMGYLAQPHTSAGRVPTDFGYRAFVDDLLSREDEEGVDEDDPLAKELRESARDLDDLMERTSQALARFTDCMTLLVPPRFLTVDIRLINLVLLTPQRLLAVIVTDDGQVFNRQMDLSREYSQEEVEKTQSLLNKVLAGKSLSSTSSVPPLDMDAIHDDLFRLVMAEILACLKDQNAIKAHPLGISHLLGKPEFSDSSCLMPVLEELEGDTMLLRMFNDAVGSEEPVVRIGHENDSEALSSVSLIANRFGEAEHSGLILIVGPTRMDYSQVLKAVRAARNVLKDL
jgi:heat-inducible transcriptional repressor